MPSPRELFFQMLAKGVDTGSAGAIQGIKGRQESEQNDADRALRELLQGKAEAFKRDEDRGQRDYLEQLRKQNPGTAVTSGNYSINPEAPQSPRLQLTPAQEQAEKDAGKQITAYSVAGGKPALDKNLTAMEEVKKELAAGKRDNWDRFVGGAASSLPLIGGPTLMGFLAPTEKARRDKVRQAANSAAKATDPNPTEKQIEQIMGQVYDPSADNTTLEQKVGSFAQETRGKAADIERALGNYNRTGYATMGGAGGPSQPETKVINGVTYVRVNGGWKKQ